MIVHQPDPARGTLRRVLVLGSLVFLVSLPRPLAVAAEGGDTTEGRITARGVATRHVAADVLEIDFAITTEATSVTTAKAAADDLARRLQEVIASQDLGTLSLDYDFGLLKTRAVYFKKGSKVDHQITATLRDIGPESLHDSLAAVIDRALALDSRLTIGDIRSKVSDKLAAGVERELLGEAVKDARAKAEVIASAAGLRLGRPRSVYSTPLPRDPYEYEIVERVRVTAGGFGLHSREGFTVDGSLAPTVRMSVEVTAVFETGPP